MTAYSELSTEALESFETLLRPDLEGAGFVSQNFSDGVALRQMETQYVRLGTPILAEVQASIEDYRVGPLKQLAKFTIKKFAIDTPKPLTHEYHLESFTGGGFQCLVSTLDAMKAGGADIRRMQSNDFKNLLQEINRTVELENLAAKVIQ